MSVLPPCPVAVSHRRLMDCHEHWHAAADNYMSPDGFRVNVNALIQGLRNVTFMLQRRRRDLPDFEEWYGRWTESISQDEIMRWVVKSRNRIVKESDLELLSTVNIRLSMDWLHEIEETWEMPARFDTRNILMRLMSGGSPLPPAGTLTIERRWVDKYLPEWELLDATAQAYDRLAQLLDVAHGRAGVQECDLPRRDRSCVTVDLRTSSGCMSFRDGNRLLHIDLSSREEFTEKYHIVEYDKDLAERTRERYGAMPLNGTAIEMVPSVLEISKRMLSADKVLMTVAWIIRDGAVIQFYPIIFPNREAKRFMMHRLAERVRMLDADGVVFVGETWLLTAEPVPRLEDAYYVERTKGRREAINVVGITRDGECTDRSLFFDRNQQGEIVYGELWSDAGGDINFLEPIRKMWSARE